MKRCGLLVAAALLSTACSKDAQPAARTEVPAAKETPTPAAPPQAPPKDLMTETSRRHLETILAWQRDHLPVIGAEPVKQADETDAGFTQRLRAWRSEGGRAISAYENSMCVSITQISCPQSPLSKALKDQGFRGTMECGVVDVVEEERLLEVVCASKEDGKPQFTVWGSPRQPVLRKGQVVRFTNLRLGNVSRRFAPLFRFRGNLPLEPKIGLEVLSGL